MIFPELGRDFDFFHRYHFSKATLSLSLSLQVISSATSQFAIPNFTSFTATFLATRESRIRTGGKTEGLLIEGKKKGSFSWIFLFFFMNMSRVSEVDPCFLHDA